MPVARDTVLLGQRGEIHAGEEIPETWVDSLGAEHKTDFDRLRELGLVDGEAETPRRGRKPAAEPQ